MLGLRIVAGGGLFEIVDFFLGGEFAGEEFGEIVERAAFLRCSLLRRRLKQGAARRQGVGRRSGANGFWRLRRRSGRIRFCAVRRCVVGSAYLRRGAVRRGYGSGQGLAGACGEDGWR